MAIPPEVTYGSEQFRTDWLVTLKERAMLGSTTQAYAMLRAVLREVRDRSSLDAALRIADALPPLVRGIMLEGWHPATSTPNNPPLFAEAVRQRLEPHTPPPGDLVEDVLWLLARNVLPQYRAVLTENLPPELRDAWRTARAGQGQT